MAITGLTRASIRTSILSAFTSRLGALGLSVDVSSGSYHYRLADRLAGQGCGVGFLGEFAVGREFVAERLRRLAVLDLRLLLVGREEHDAEKPGLGVVGAHGVGVGSVDRRGGRKTG